MTKIIILGRSIAALTAAVAAAETAQDILHIVLFQPAISTFDTSLRSNTPTPSHGPPPSLSHLSSVVSADEDDEQILSSKLSFVRTGVADTSVLEVVGSQAHSVLQWMAEGGNPPEAEWSLQDVVSMVSERFRKIQHLIEVVEFSEIMSLDRDLMMEKYYGDILGDIGDQKEGLHATQRAVCVTGVHYKDVDHVERLLKADAVILAPTTSSELYMLRNMPPEKTKGLGLEYFSGFSKKQALQLTLKCSGTVVLPSVESHVGIAFVSHDRPHLFSPTRFYINTEQSQNVAFVLLGKDNKLCPASQVLQSESDSFYLHVFSSKHIESNDLGSDVIRTYCRLGLLQRFEDIQHVCQFFNIEGVISELSTKFVVSDSDDPVFFYATVVCASRCGTLGGIEINSSSEVQFFKKDLLEKSSKTILGLFAAGLVCGGMHSFRHLPWSAMMECILFAFIAGKRASSMNTIDHQSEEKESSQICLSPDNWIPLTLRDRKDLGHFTKLFRFDLPSPQSKVRLQVGQYIAVRACIKGEMMERFYSPISRPDDPGHIDLLVKIDPEKNSGMGWYFEKMRLRDTLEFRGPLGALRLDLGDKANLKFKKLGLVAGGSGLSPMLQIIRSGFYYKRSDIEMTLLYAANIVDELVCSEILSAKAQKHPEFKVVYVLNNPPADWKGEVGFINSDVISKHLPAPADDVKIVLCGSWGMCKALKPVFAQLGYTEDNFYSFL